jgi:hypothetical protein
VGIAPGICPFCPSQATKLTREHLVSAWIGELFNSSGYNLHRYTEAGLVKKWRKAKLDEKAFAACRECNNGWMGDIETEMKAAFSHIIRDGVKVSLLPSGLALLAAFAFKCAVVADYINPADGTLFYTSHTRHKFRASLQIPNGVQMWLWAFQRVYVNSGVFNSYYLKPRPVSGTLDDVNFHVFTFLAGCLGFQVVSSKWTDVRQSGQKPPLLCPESIWESAAVRFWPLDGLPVSFPPRHCLSNNSLEAFINRFQGSVTMRVA